MIINLAADHDYVYSVDDVGALVRYKIGTTGVIETIPGPGHGFAIMSITASDDFLHTVHDDGLIFRRYYSNGSWERVPVGFKAISLTSNDQAYFAIGSDLGVKKIYQRDDVAGNFMEISVPAGVNDPERITSNHGYTAILNGDSTIWVQKYANGSWSQYPVPLANVIEIEMDQQHMYALTSAGTVYRSRLFGRSGWDDFTRVTDLTSITIASSQEDVLWFSGGTTVRGVSGGGWDYDGAPIIEFWVSSGWVESGWVAA